jgi:hypothetical protein
MAGFKYATKDLSITTAEAFVESVRAEDTSTEKKSSILYVCLGRSREWPNEPVPITPPDNEQHLHYELHRKFIGGKKVTPSDISHVTTRHNWVTGTVYSMYRDTDTDMYDRPFFVFTNENNVYKCLYNNNGNASTVKPKGFALHPVTTSDGYTWKYMYTIPLGDEQKFMNHQFIPVKNATAENSVENGRQLAVQNSAVNGAIHIVETTDGGVNYDSFVNGSVESASTTTIKLIADPLNHPSVVEGMYTGDSVYISSGTGVGQLRRIINYDDNRTLTVNSPFTVVANTDSSVIISPTVTIIGDGVGAQAYSSVTTDSISSINMLDVGTGYTRGQALITSNTEHGTGATGKCIISPQGGHGSNPIRELYGDKVMLNVQIHGSEGVSANGNGYIPSNTEFRTISVLKDPTLRCDSNNNFTVTQNVANTTNSPPTLRLCSRLDISYKQMDNDIVVNPLQESDTITNKRVLDLALSGSLEFVTQLGGTALEAAALTNALQAANANIVLIHNVTENGVVADASHHIMYINSVESFGNYVPFSTNDIILKSGSIIEVATIESIAGSEANTFSGEILYTENITVAQRDPEQIEDIQLILDF